MQGESLGVLFGFLQSLAWAVTTIVLRSLSTRLDAFLVNGVRAFFAMFIILPLVLLTGGTGDYQLLTPTRLLYLVGSSVLSGVFADASYVFSLRLLGVGRAFPISNTYPLFTILFSVLLLGEQVSWPMVVGVVLTLLGVYVVARAREGVDEADEFPQPSRRLAKGFLLAVATAVSWGLTTVIVSMGAEGINSAVITSVRVPAVAVLSTLVGARRERLRSLRCLDRGVVRSLVLAGILGWGIGGTLWTASVQLAGPTKSAIIAATAPLFGVPLSSIFLHEKPTRQTLVGTVLTVVGIILVL